MMIIKQEPFLLLSTSVASAGYNDSEISTTATPLNKKNVAERFLLRYVDLTKYRIIVHEIISEIQYHIINFQA